MEAAAVVNKAAVDEDAPDGANVGGGTIGCFGIRTFARSGFAGMYMVTGRVAGDAGQTIVLH